MIGEWWSGREVVMALFKVLSSTCLEELRKTMKNRSQNSQFSSQDLNPRPPKYETGLLSTGPWYSVICNYKFIRVSPVCKALELFVMGTFVPCVPAAALLLLHVAQCMLWCACMCWHVRFSARIRSLFAWMLSYTTVSGNPWLLSSMSTTTGVCANHMFSCCVLFF
jgi:hypothetical protein